MKVRIMNLKTSLRIKKSLLMVSNLSMKELRIQLLTNKKTTMSTMKKMLRVYTCLMEK